MGGIVKKTPCTNSFQTCRGTRRKKGSGSRGEEEERAVTIVIVSFRPALAVRREDRAWSIFGREDGPLGGRRITESSGRR